MAGPVADYQITSTIVDDASAPVLAGRAPGRLGLSGPVTIWGLGPVTRAPWALAQARLEQAAAIRGEGLPDWLEAGTSDWAGRPLVWVSARGQATSTLASSGHPDQVPARLHALARAARGADALHRQGVLHGAICPQAVVILEPGGGQEASAVLAPPSVADGRDLALHVGYPPLAFADPQLLRGEGGRWSDIWGLGATALYVLTGRAPFRGVDEQPVVQAVAQMLTFPSLNLDGAPGPAAELIGACLARDPADRPATAAEVARRAEEAASSWVS